MAIKEEIIADYGCSNCNEKHDTVKQSLIKDLPNILIIHMQRIIFDMDTFSNEKIASKLDF